MLNDQLITLFAWRPDKLWLLWWVTRDDLGELISLWRRDSEVEQVESIGSCEVLGKSSLGRVLLLAGVLDAFDGWFLWCDAFLVASFISWNFSINCNKKEKKI